ncbi:hypothetical protein IE53DRAFT_391024, partial [Violaceomyces palustris]
MFLFSPRSYFTLAAALLPPFHLLCSTQPLHFSRHRQAGSGQVDPLDHSSHQKDRKKRRKKKKNKKRKRRRY